MVYQWRKAIVPVSVCTGGLTIGVAAAAACLTAWIARQAVMPSRNFQYDVRIRSVAADLSTITLQATLESTVPGRYGFWLADQAGHIRIGEILETTPTSVTRRIEKVTFGDIHSGERGRVSGWYTCGPSYWGFRSGASQSQPKAAAPLRGCSRRSKARIDGRFTCMGAASADTAVCAPFRSSVTTASPI